MANWYEFLIGTNPQKWSTVDDGIPDGWKVRYRLNPLDRNVAGRIARAGVWTNLQYYQAGLNPNVTDSDGNGLPDWWETKYFGSVGGDPNADPDGDGFTNLQEFLNGTDPTDFYNGVLPTLAMVAGSYQRGAPASWLSVPISVKFGSGISGAPVTFTVTQGGARIGVPNGAASTTLQVRSTSSFTDPQGHQFNVAQVDVLAPSTLSDSSIVRATVTTGGHTVSVGTVVVGSTSDAGGANSSFLVGQDRHSHAMGFADASGTFLPVTRGGDWTGLDGAPRTEFFVLGAPNPPAWVIDLTTMEKASPLAGDLAAVAWQPNDIPIPVISTRVWLDAVENANGFTVHSRVSGGQEQLQAVNPNSVTNSDSADWSLNDANGNTFSIPASTTVGELDFAIGYGMEFWLTRNVDRWESPHFHNNGQGYAGNPPAVWSLLGAIPPRPPANWVQMNFTVDLGRSVNYSVHQADGTISSIPINYSGSIWSYNSQGSLDGATYSYGTGTVSVDASQSWWLVDENSGLAYPPGLTDNIPGWIPGPDSPGTITLDLPGFRRSHRLHLQNINGNIWPITGETYLAPLAGGPVPIGGYEDHTIQAADASGALTYTLPWFRVTAEVGPEEYWVVDDTTGETAPHNQNELTHWFSPPIAQALTLSTTRWFHDLSLVQPTGEMFPISRSATQGDVSWDVNGNSWWNSYWTFGATASMDFIFDYWIFDNSTGEYAPVNSADLGGWTSSDAPTQLVATTLTTSAISLQWQPGSAIPQSAAGYRVRRMHDSGPWQDLAIVPLGKLSYLDTGLDLNVAYTYRVETVYPTGASLPSSDVTLTTLANIEGDGIPDVWKIAHGLDPNDPNVANATASAGGMSNADKYKENLDPNKTDSDGDGVPDVDDSWPNEKLINHKRMPVTKYAVYEIDKDTDTGPISLIALNNKNEVIDRKGNNYYFWNVTAGPMQIQCISVTSMSDNGDVFGSDNDGAFIWRKDSQTKDRVGTHAQNWDPAPTYEGNTFSLTNYRNQRTMNFTMHDNPAFQALAIAGDGTLWGTATRVVSAALDTGGEDPVNNPVRDFWASISGPAKNHQCMNWSGFTGNNDQDYRWFQSTPYPPAVVEGGLYPNDTDPNRRWLPDWESGRNFSTVPLVCNDSGDVFCLATSGVGESPNYQWYDDGLNDYTLKPWSGATKTSVYMKSTGDYFGPTNIASSDSPPNPLAMDSAGDLLVSSGFLIWKDGVYRKVNAPLVPVGENPPNISWMAFNDNLQAIGTETTDTETRLVTLINDQSYPMKDLLPSDWTLHGFGG